ncbi:Putative LRR receptor-like serine/threonine-protein kinase [Glycine soja]|nr:Putative LRR receptor-like serine/threonine-protein kinase [Glycine soja]
MSLSQNNLTGSIPGSVFCNGSVHAPSLRIVHLGFNGFTDFVGPETSSTCFSVLQVLDIQHNRIRGTFPLWLTNVTTLTVLDVSSNALSGEVPPEIGSLIKLEELKMAKNSFTGTIPVELKKCGSLSVVDFEGNGFGGEVPSFFGDMIGLKVLSLGGNHFSGSVPVSFGNLSFLETLSLRGNRLNGSMPETIMRLNNLTILDLSGNKFTGQVYTSIGNLNRLMVLNLSGNGFSGNIPASLGSLFRLTTLDLSKQNLSGELPLELSGLPSLQVVALQENKLSGEVPEGFSSLMSLQYVNLSSNAFSGHIPENYGFLRSLLVLSLSDNHITGTIPSEIGNCSGIEMLELGSNSLAGHIPADLSRLTLLKLLDLSGNNLTGDVPEEISKCSSLTTLFVDHNHLSGAIPGSLSDLSNLTMLDLSANNLSGVIPSNLSMISGLVYFNVSGNNLDGEIPPTLGSWFSNPSVFANNQGLCGKPLDKKCEDINGKNRKRLIVLVVVIACGAFALVLFCCFYVFSLLRWRKRLKQGVSGEKKKSPARASSGTSAARSSSTQSGGPKLVMFNTKITLAETIEATRQFDEENVLSRTRHGLVFKACYNDGMVLSIRRLQDGSLDENMFRKEAESLGKVKNRNLTVLRGYYAGPPDMRLLVYDYMPNGNLATLLQEASHQDGHVLNWPMRHLIALGIARGLAFLHQSSIVHGDVKPQNVLFDADFEAHLSDFGLDKLTRATPGEASTSTSVGTLGYVSPEAVLTGEASKESDVYSFGIVLLELLTGKRPVMFTQDEDIVKWVKKQLQRGQITELLEPGLLELDPESSEWEEFLLGVKVGLLCTAPDLLDRPTMSDIVFMLEGCRVGPDIPSSADPTSQPSPA